MLEVGDVARLTFSPVNAAGAPADPTLVVVTVTLPDSTTSTPVVAHPGVGEYTAAPAATQPGRHVARWVGTGAIAAAQTEVFDVWPTNPRFAISLAEARTALNWDDATDTSHDDELRLFVAAATMVIEDVTGPIFGSQSFSERHYPTGDTIVLHHTRALDFTSVVEYRSGQPTTLTEAATPDVATADQFLSNPATGILTRVSTSGSPYWFGDQVWVTYTAGALVIPDNVILAARELVQFSYQSSQQGGRPAFEGGPGEEMVATPSGWLVPYRVMAWLKPHERVRAGFA